MAFLERKAATSAAKGRRPFTVTAPKLSEMVDGDGGFAVVAGDYMSPPVSTIIERCPPYASKPMNTSAVNMVGRSAYPYAEDWTAAAVDGEASGYQGRYSTFGFAPETAIASYESLRSSQHNSPPLPPPPLPRNGGKGRRHSSDGGGAAVAPALYPYTCRGPNVEHASRKQHRLHQDFKALPKEERQRLVEEQAATSDLLARTVHLRFLPLTMLQSELASLCTDCGEYLRVRICGNSTNNQNWIYGFVEFATTAGAEALMRRSGMELSNGPDRPPLRLKCNTAKQPIVDRVFHDADPATGTPCIFGLGNFSKRTLGDALESYYNLKEKEAQQGQEAGESPTPTTPAARLDAGLSLAKMPMRLSPHARAFCPASSSLPAPPLPTAEFLPGVHHAPSSEVMRQSPESATGATPTSSIEAAGLQADAEEAVGADWTAGVVAKFATRSEAAPWGPSASMATTPLPPYTSLAGEQVAHNRAPHGSGGGIVGGSATAAAGVFGTPSMFLPTSPCRFSFGALSMPTPREMTAVAAEAFSFSSSPVGGCTPEFLQLPPSTAMPSDVVGSELSEALQHMMRTHAAADAEEVLRRGQELTLRAISQAHGFLNSQQGFYDAMGTLRSLVELLDCHAAITGGPEATAAGDHTADLPQRATQLRLLANLMMALLYMMRRNLNDAIPYIHAAVMCCNAIPVVCLRSKAAPSHTATVPLLGPTSSASSVPSTKEEVVEPPLGWDIAEPLKATAAPRWRGLAVGDGEDSIEEELQEGYNCFGAPKSFLEAVLESIREEEEEVQDSEGGPHGRTPTAVTQDVLQTDHQTGDTVSTSSAEAQALLLRDQQFHRYVLGVLVAIGLSMEEVQPVITRSTYVLAAGRATDILGVACTDVDESLKSTTPSPRLCDRLFAVQMKAAGGGGSSNPAKRDITFFPRLFFSTAEKVRQEVLGAADGEQTFWQRLPPRQCVPCYE